MPGLDASLGHRYYRETVLDREALLGRRNRPDIRPEPGGRTEPPLENGRIALPAAAIHQEFLARAAAVFCWSAVFRRNMSKYGDRGMRYICMDAGHICQNLLLAATALGRPACPVAAFFDDELNAILGVDGEEEGALYLAAVG